MSLKKKSEDVEALRLVDAADNYLEQGQIEPAILLRDKKLTAEDMLSAAVPIMEKVNTLLFGAGAHQAD